MTSAAAAVVAGPPARPRSGGPLSQVLSAFREGAGSLDQIAERTGLPGTIVRTSVGHLIRMGRIQAKELSAGCPGGGCSSCASATAEGTPGCGAAGPSPLRRGPVLVELRLR
ncbi:FeoC-like transcriptional regulator [Acidipropionibacterium virtanenii]|uniref:FeoC-like transcriptional regulator n=1 Tax=Acidipropionibacterium virtanenii TaxID=2057246 RepID=UPI0015F0735A|nr:FeoC-like transcriptional regulator [Acidipropionibacterium virtanenii]